MSFEVKGIIRNILPLETRGEKDFKTRDFVLEVADEKYPQLIKFQTVQDRTDILDHYGIDEPVTVYFELVGREWNGKYLTNLKCWKMTRVGDKSPAAAAPAPTPPNQTKLPVKANAPVAHFQTSDIKILPQDADDLPF